MRFTNALLCLVVLGASVAACRVASPGQGEASQAAPSPASSIAATDSAASDAADDPSAAPSLDEGEQRMVALAIEDLASRLEVDEDEISTVRVRAVEWRDGSLGCPKPNVHYIQRITPGFHIWLDARGDVYEYHTDDDSHVILCAER
jgi:hypothetical protein